MTPRDRATPFDSGSLRAKLADIARDAGVSVATASRALSRPELVARETRELVQSAAAKAGYRPNLVARSLRTQSSFAVFVLVPELESPSYADVVRGLDWTAHERGYSLMLGVTGHEPARKASYLDKAIRQRADGLVILDGLLGVDVTPHPGTAMPCIQVLERNPGYLSPSVTANDREAACAAVQHLIDLGHRRIGYICGAPHAFTSSLRKDGYREALQASGLDLDPRLIVHGGRTVPSGIAAFASLMSRNPQPTAVFCASDQLAQAALHGAAQLGFDVPQQVSIMGFDGLEISASTAPPLTTVRVPRYDMGVVAMTLMLDLIAGVEVEQPHVVLPAELLVRESTARPLQ